MNATITSGIKCGNCKNHHESVQAVRACYGQPIPATSGVAPGVKNVKPATEKQIAFIQRLQQERGQALDATALPLTSKTASLLIEHLMALPKVAPAAHPQAVAQAAKAEPLTDGMYLKDEVIYKIQKAVHGSGHLYAKRLVPGEGYGSKATFVYAPGAMKALTLADRMTLEQAKAFGALYGTCCVCGRTLTNEDSIEAGIGPVCGKRFDA